MDWKMRLVSRTGVYKWLPPSLLLKVSKMAADYVFSVKSVNESFLLKTILTETDSFFVQWAIAQIMIWQGGTCCANLIHIHGTKDRIFPIGRIKGVVKVEGGGHFMIVNKAAVISTLLRKELEG